MSTALDEYRVARQAQDARYEDVTGLPIGEEDRQEWRDYFGQGDYAGKPVETRVTPKAWMVNGAAEQEANNGCVTDRQAFYMSGADLAALAGQGDYVAAGEITRRAVKRAQKRGAAA